MEITEILQSDNKEAMNEVNASNIDQLIASVKEEIRNGNPFAGSFEKPAYFLFPASFRGGLDRSKYKGRGRPRNSDYERLDTLKEFGKLSNGFEYGDTRDTK